MHGNPEKFPAYPNVFQFNDLGLFRRRLAVCSPGWVSVIKSAISKIKIHQRFCLCIKLKNLFGKITRQTTHFNKCNKIN